MTTSTKRRKANLKQQYEALWSLTAEVIRQWDPYGLLASGSPIDEFDSEIASLVAQVSRIHSSTDAALAVSRVFSSSFEPGPFAPEACAEVGSRLFARLSERGLIE